MGLKIVIFFDELRGCSKKHQEDGDNSLTTKNS